MHDDVAGDVCDVCRAVTKYTYTSDTDACIVHIVLC